MKTLTAEEVSGYLHRCYAAVDGLWFMKVEEMFGTEAAIKADEEVWKVLPKIQARKLREFVDEKEGLAGLRRCLELKLAIDGFEFEVEEQSNGFVVRIGGCPWLGLLEKSGRTHLAAEIGERVCGAEYEGWAKEFGAGIRFELGAKKCDGAEGCVLRFLG